MADRYGTAQEAQVEQDLVKGNQYLLDPHT